MWRAKVDTGARTSALHVEDVEELPRDRLRFKVVTGRKPPFRRRTVMARLVKTARVKSSNGHYSTRYFVRTRIAIGDRRKDIELSLVSREKMVYRMLLGRTALAGDFVVDVSRRYIQSADMR